MADFRQQFTPELEDDDDSLDFKPTAFQKFIAIITCRSDNHETFSGAEDSIRVGLKKGVSDPSGQKKARNGNMYVPRAAMPILENKDLDHTEETNDTK